MSAVLGILDWGIGGVGFLARVRARFPELPVVYWSDSGFAPYGLVDADTLAARLDEIRGTLAAAYGVTYLVVACNAASTVLGRLPKGLPTQGVITPGVRAVLASAPRATHFGVVGGERTIASNAWSAPLQAAGHRVTQAVAQPISAYIEAGNLSGRALDEALGRVLTPFYHADIDTLILACTHYPAAQPAFEAYLPGVAMIDPVAAAVVDAAKHGRLHLGLGGGLTAVTTGDPQAMQNSALRAFQFYFPSITCLPHS